MGREFLSLKEHKYKMEPTHWKLEPLKTKALLVPKIFQNLLNRSGFHRRIHHLNKNAINTNLCTINHALIKCPILGLDQILLRVKFQDIPYSDKTLILSGLDFQ